MSHGRFDRIGNSGRSKITAELWAETTANGLLTLFGDMVLEKGGLSVLCIHCQSIELTRANARRGFVWTTTKSGGAKVVVTFVAF